MFVFVMLFILILVGVLGVFVMDSLLVMSFVFCFLLLDLCLIFYKLGDCGLVYWFFFVFMDKVCFILIGFFIVWRII